MSRSTGSRKSGPCAITALKGEPVGTAAFEYYQANREQFLEGLKTLLRIPSISTLPAHKSDIARAAEFIARELTEMGMEGVEIIPGKPAAAGGPAQHPLVYAEW